MGSFSAPTNSGASGFLLFPSRWATSTGMASLISPWRTAATTSRSCLATGRAASPDPTNFGAGTNPASVAVGDFNLDGKPDLAVANPAPNNVSVLLNNCTTAPTPTPTPGGLLSDDFNDNSRDTSKWNWASFSRPGSAFDALVQVREQNQRLEITPRALVSGTHFNGYVSVATWNLTDSRASVEVVQSTDTSDYAETVFGVGIDDALTGTGSSRGAPGKSSTSS